MYNATLRNHMNKVVITILWTLVFLVSYTILSVVGFIPLELAEMNARAMDTVSSLRTVIGAPAPAAVAGAVSTTTSISESFRQMVLPERIVIEKIGVNAPVKNPETRDIVTLDKALLEGVVRFPGSGGLDDESNMFLFGHSTSFKTVHNPAFQSFNRLGELQIGDAISLRSGDTDYLYKVFSVSQVDKDDALVEF